MKNNKLNRMYFGHKKERIQIAHLNRPMMLGYVGFVESPLLEKPALLVLSNCEDDDLAALRIFGTGTSVIMMQKEIFYGFKSGNLAARTILFHEIGHLIRGGHEEYIGKREQYDEDRLNSLKEGKILGLEEVADDFAVEYLGAEYVIQGFRELIETTRPLEGTRSF